MLLRTRLYLRLNELTGSPQGASRAISAAKATRIFENDTIAFLERWASYLSQTADVLIVGSGIGTELPWFASRARSVTAIDVNPNAIAASREVARDLPNVHVRLVGPRELPFPEKTFDTIFMHNVCEHLLTIDECFAEYHRVLRSDGALLNSFSPLFYSPFGAHLSEALTLPWGHLIFGLAPVIEVRNLYFPGFSTARSWGELGLNRITESRYKKVIKASGFKEIFHRVFISRRLPVVGRIPMIRNLFILGIESVLVK
jgi:SAM-dependent methyltransferase